MVDSKEQNLSVLIKSATIVDPESEYHGKKRDILIVDGKIDKIGSSLKTEGSDLKVLKLKNLHVSKGWFDCSVSFGEPGFEDRETLEGGLSVAACSGYCDLIYNTSTLPVPDGSGGIRFLLDRAKHSACRLHPLGSITRKSKGEELAELFDMHRHGAIGFSEDQMHLGNTHLFQLALEYSTLFDGCIFSFPLEQHLSSRGSVNEGSVSVRMGVKGIPVEAEEIAVQRDLRMLDYTGGKLHFSLVSCEGSVRLLADAKKKGKNVSSAVSIDHLYFTEEDIREFDNNLKILPPIRTKKDQKALRDALKDGIIDLVTSDHRPLSREEKEVEFGRSHYGSIGLENAFSVLQDVYDRDTAIRLLTRGKSRFGVDDIPISTGYPARLSLFDPDKVYRYNETSILGKARNSPYLGKELKGQSYGIYSNGQLVLRPHVDVH